MSNGHLQIRQPKNRRAAVEESAGFYGDVALVVIHRQDYIEFTVDTSSKNSIGTEWTIDHCALRSRPLDCRFDRRPLLVSHSMWIQPRDRDPRTRNSPITHPLIKKP